MKSNQIRQKFLDFFVDKNHTEVKSSSLVPYDDDTLLFTNAGMVQFKNVFTGNDERAYTKATSVQRCVRAGGKHNDLENVGFTARHHTFFEMLGNFSFGDYFKEEAITLAWEFLTKTLKLSEEKLWVTVYEKDLEAETIWFDKIGISKKRFSRCGKKDNFWQMGDVGPCGPCSEIFYDHGDTIKGEPPGYPDEDGDRYIEIWNLVFMQYNRDADGNLTALPKPSVDTGMGLERLAAILQGVHSNYEIDSFQSLMKSIAKILDIQNHDQTSIRVIADHIRSCAFMIVDGIIPGNEGRAYVLRRIIRRAIRHGHKLGFKDLFFYKIVKFLTKELGQTYPELTENQSKVESVLKKEELRFAETLDSGMNILQEYLSTLKDNIISGEMVFKLYDTFGFPVDLTADIAREKNLKLDMDAYQKAMQNQQTMARSAGEFKTIKTDLKLTTKTEFVGYEHLKSQSLITDIIIDDKPVDELSQSQNAIIILKQTPFYAESGGQVGDIGEIFSKNSNFIVSDTQKSNKAILHFGKLKKGKLKIGDKVTAKVNKNSRFRIACNHSATHLLHAALRDILGNTVAQKGSLVDKNRLRFDFLHDEPISNDELQEIENLVNFQINKDISVKTEIKNIKDAKKSGAMALFGEKYTENVRVLTMENFSIELCGGTHIENTSNIKLFKIINETGVASGVRRIEAVSNERAIKLLQNSHQTLEIINKKLNANPQNINDKIQNLITQNKQLSKELQNLRRQSIKSQNSDLISKAKEINGVKILIEIVESMNIKSLRNLIDDLKSKMDKSVILLASVVDDKIMLVCGVSKNITDKIKAGDIMKEITTKIDGKGGGRPDMAQGGGTDVKSLPNEMSEIKNLVENKLCPQ